MIPLPGFLPLSFPAAFLGVAWQDILIHRQGIENIDVEAVKHDPPAGSTHSTMPAHGTGKGESQSEPESDSHPKVSMSGATGYEGVNLVQKLVFFGIIVGCIFMFLRLRNRQSASYLMEKYPA